MPLDPHSFEVIADLAGGVSSVLAAVDVSQANSIEEVLALEVKYQHAAPDVKWLVSKRIDRGRIGDLVKKKQGYRCSACTALQRDPMTFIAKSGFPFVEAHHVIPVSTRKIGVLATPNVLALCANHHRQMHYGDCTLLSEDDLKFRFRIDGAEVIIPKTKLL